MSRTAAIRGPDRLSPEEKQKIDAALPAEAPAKPKKPRKLLVLDVNIAYGGHGSIPAENYALEMMQFLDPGLASQHQRPILAFGGSENVIILRLHSIHGEVSVPLILVGIRFGISESADLPRDRRPRRAQTCRCVIQDLRSPNNCRTPRTRNRAGSGLHPSDLDPKIQVCRIRIRVVSLIVMELIDADCVAVGHNCPVILISVNPRGIIFAGN
jgi:hypothetical protein